MSLRGSLDTFALPDVLALLATTAKTGELHVTGGPGGGRVWVENGQITAAEAAGTSSVVDVLVHLLRLEDGDFTFHADHQAPTPEAPVEIATVLAQADARLTEWREVEQLLPSPAAMVTLVAAAPGSVRLSKDQWAVVVAVGEGRAVDEVVERLSGDELSRWRLVANLVEAGLLEVGAPVAVAPVRRTELAEQLSTLHEQAIAEHDDTHDAGEELDDEAIYEVAETDDADEADDEAEAHDAPVPVVAAADAADPAEGVSRGTLLKFLSSVRS
jgi:hypothetical protein